MEELDRDEFIPYWVDHWPSADVALRELPALLKKPTHLCELGAGLGILATYLAYLGHRVVATDYAPESCRVTQQNMEKNRVSGHVVACDWRHSCFAHTFDAIIGVDILYEARWISPVLQFIQRHLSPQGRAYIFDPGRPQLKAVEQTLQGLDLRYTRSSYAKTTSPGEVFLLTIQQGKTP